MGYYINPTDTNKETWLALNGKRITQDEAILFWDNPDHTHFPVCWVDNGWMTAAGIAYDDDETKRFASPDGRNKRWYLVSGEKLDEVMGSLPWPGRKA